MKTFQTTEEDHPRLRAWSLRLDGFVGTALAGATLAAAFVTAPYLFALVDLVAVR